MTQSAATVYCFFPKDNSAAPSKEIEAFLAAVFHHLQLVDLPVQQLPSQTKRFGKNTNEGHAAMWHVAHEMDEVLVAFSHVPDVMGAEKAWTDTLRTLGEFDNALPSDRRAYGPVIVLEGYGKELELHAIAERVLRKALPAAAEFPWGRMLGAGAEGPFLAVTMTAPRDQVDVFLSESWRKVLYAITKGHVQFSVHYDAALDSLRSIQDRVRVLLDGLRDGEALSDEGVNRLLAEALQIGRVINHSAGDTSQASRNLGIARANRRRALDGQLVLDHGLVEGMDEKLGEQGTLLSTVAEALESESAQVDRAIHWARGIIDGKQQSALLLNTQASNRLLERSTNLLAAAHLIEFVLVFYYSLGAWSYVVGHSVFDDVPMAWKAGWAGATSLGAVLVTGKNHNHLRAVAMLIAVLLLSGVAAALMSNARLPGG